MEWLNSEDKTSSKNHMILKKFKNDKECSIYDNTLNSEIIVTINEVYHSVYPVKMIVVHT